MKGIDDSNNILRDTLNTMRRIFLTNWAAFTLMQNQMESILRTLLQGRAQTHAVMLDFMKRWVEEFKRARAHFQKMVEEVFILAQRDLERIHGKKARLESGGRIPPVFDSMEDAAESADPGSASRMAAALSPAEGDPDPEQGRRF